jgi:hypothetical protein
MNSSIIHDNRCSLIHKKCYPKSYQSDTKYQMTLNIISCAVSLPAGENNSGGFEVRGSQEPCGGCHLMKCAGKACKDAAGPDLCRRCKPPPPVTLTLPLQARLICMCVCVCVCMYVGEFSALLGSSSSRFSLPRRDEVLPP